MKTKNKITIKSVLLFCVALSTSQLSNAQVEKVSTEFKELPVRNTAEPCISKAEYEQLKADIETNVARLKKEGKYIRTQNQGKVLPPQKFDWPLTYETNFLGNDYFFIQNYVDHAPAQGVISEYMCGTRSYDLVGYNHQGTDICIGPYWWNMMDDMKVRIIAGAPGQIVGRNEGNFDRNCAMGGGGSANSITIEHEDGTRALYWHMKNGSVTDKVIGDFVAKGEYLGYVGSSGSSTNPHLHFEVQDSSGNFIDPWEGPCNNDIVSSLWNSQKPYPNSGIMSILTMTGAPTVPVCPAPETVPYSNHFNAGDPVRLEIHLRDLVPGTVYITKLYNPAGNVIGTWNDTVGNNFIAGGWRAYNFSFNNNAATGTYKIQVTYGGKTATHYITLGCPPAYNLSGQITGRNGFLTGEEITTTHTIPGVSGNKIWYEAETYIQGNPGFRATQGCSFRARIDNCSIGNSIAFREIAEQPQVILLQANPSLVTDKTQLMLKLSETNSVTISVFDLTGRKVKSVINNQQTIDGNHTFELNTADIVSGVYICTAETNNSKSSCRIIVQK